VLEKPLKRPNLLKFIIAFYCKGIFEKEDYFVKFCDELDKRKEVASMMKPLKTLARLNKH
jgi:hypothetical protein